MEVHAPAETALVEDIHERRGDPYPDRHREEAGDETREPRRPARGQRAPLVSCRVPARGRALRVRSSSNAMSAENTPAKAITAASSRSTRVMAKVRSKSRMDSARMVRLCVIPTPRPSGRRASTAARSRASPIPAAGIDPDAAVPPALPVAFIGPPAHRHPAAVGAVIVIDPGDAQGLRPAIGAQRDTVPPVQIAMIGQGLGDQHRPLFLKGPP